ncbi:WYL domain-containing protein [Desulfonema magnum]|uniref:WYL domain-containing protein n=1 Tax=Desulfonema magnum TaxID=45655 RepID=A0A975BN26_9BACT|nr:WYL domain-containing protein [Desulfonema magnum]QTA88203.1 WYL domain-containing protein [Desulfonema magnum]
MKLYTYKQQKRFAYIETQLFWGDGLTAGKLAETFGLSRQAAQTVIDRYREEYPEQMEYNPSRKRHEASETFRPHIIKTSPILFLDYLRGESLTGYYREERGWSDLDVVDVDRLLRPDLPLEPARIVIAALLGQRVVSIDYHSKNPESPFTRLLSPNHLVFADDRYHIRAYCHRRKSFRDFVLSRISYAELTDKDWVSSREDREWHYIVELHFKPNPDLSESVQEAILKNYEDTHEGCRVIRCKKALAIYIERKLVRTIYPKYGMPLWISYKRP